MVADEVPESDVCSHSTVSYRTDVLKSVLSQQCVDVGWHGVTESSLNALTEVLDRYLKGMARRIAGYAELAGHDKATVDDFRLSLRDQEPSVSLKELSNFCSNLKEVSLNIDFVFPVKTQSDLEKYAQSFTPEVTKSKEDETTVEKRFPRPEWMDEDLIFPPIHNNHLESALPENVTASIESDLRNIATNVEVIIADVDEEVPVVEPPLGSIPKLPVSPTSVTRLGDGTAWPRQLRALAVIDGQLVEHRVAKEWSSRLPMELKLSKVPAPQIVTKVPGKRKHKRSKSELETTSSKKQKTMPFEFPLATVTTKTPSKIVKEPKISKSKKGKDKVKVPESIPAPLPEVIVKTNASPPERKEPPAKTPVHQEPLMLKIKPLKITPLLDIKKSDVDKKDKSARKEEKRLKKKINQEETEETVPFLPPASSLDTSTKLVSAAGFPDGKKRKALEVEVSLFQVETQQPTSKKAKSDKHKHSKKIEEDKEHERIKNLSALVNTKSKQVDHSGKSRSSHDSGKSRSSYQALAPPVSERIKGPEQMKQENPIFSEDAAMKAPKSQPAPPSQPQPPIPKLTLKFGGKDIMSNVKKMPTMPPVVSAPVVNVPPSHNQRPFPDQSLPVQSQQSQPSYFATNYSVPSPAPLDLSMGSRSSKTAPASNSTASIPITINEEITTVRHRGRPPKEEKKKEKERPQPVVGVPIRVPTPTPPPPPPPPAPVVVQEEIPPVLADAPENWICPECSKMDDGSGAEMVACDDCDYWYHYNCVGLLAAPTVDFWYCPRCLDKRTAAKAKKNKKKKR